MPKLARFFNGANSCKIFPPFCEQIILQNSLLFQQLLGGGGSVCSTFCRENYGPCHWPSPDSITHPPSSPQRWALEEMGAPWGGGGTLVNRAKECFVFSLSNVAQTTKQTHVGHLVHLYHSFFWC
jgi:hypothetical protein